ncbi:PA14 domain protein [Rubripirellula lacrimiformis]|uniref:PA14 domain protein n=1 Tax=Rubripirellula lacrimiformis TaxID=1930273 RepID=A0A517NEV6_9BACT|nr:PA14 domain-containing protein [Rubripirellula lacrimiformis]QDT05663.1 PA14 domain protein [Rubripirellula lacrimiformis]
MRNPNSPSTTAWLGTLLFAGLCVGFSPVMADQPQFASLVPGIDIRPLPVDLTNINSVEYGPDGRLFAAGYDGRVHVLTDTDGDGLEDKSEVFWSKAGDLLTPVGILPTADGVYVAARGKIALLKDTDGDGKADVSEAVVTGWTSESHNGDTRNDAAGIAIDDDGNLYFSLGCMSYNKAWQLDAKGKSQYDLASERGTILKVSADRKHRQILATGMRFVIGLDFNEHGDLFATDQEGDTWFPGGNPRDELLHVLPGRHYGFPFRHAEYLPDVVDEPSVVDFSPQHQSTCGFRFNLPTPKRKAFGPDHWNGNAIVTGFSRGKLWRAPLAKTRAGYVGKQIQFAAFESLLTDVAVSPNGDLLVTGHSGRPDWGAGPAAKGNLYKITFDRTAPQSVAAWPASPVEVKVAFDRPVDEKQLQKAEIEYGEFVWEGDRHEWIWPGYEVVKAAKASPRRALAVGSPRISADGRTVTFPTAAHPQRVRYGITLPGVTARAGSTREPETIELSYDLGGVRGEWTREGDDKPTWKGWLPHVDPQVVKAMTAGSAEHEQLLQLLGQPGRLVLRSQLLLPGQKVALRFQSSGKFTVKCGENEVVSKPEGPSHVAEFTASAAVDANSAAPSRGDRQQVLPTETRTLEISVQTGASGEPLLLDASYQADFDRHERPLRLEHLFVPWAPPIQPSPEDDGVARPREQIAGDPSKGRELFFGSEANCAACHQFRGKGGKVAADLTVTVYRDPDAVMRDIVHPSDSINPDYVSYTILTDSGRALTGLFQQADEKQITLVDSAAKTHTISRDEIEDIRASSVSLMPNGFDKLGKASLQNLVAFLCSEDVEAKKSGLPTGVIQRQYWQDVPGSGVNALTKQKSYPAQPTGSELLTRFEGPVNWKDHYGSRIRGNIHPPQTGDYVFRLSADDHAELWLSTSDQPSDKKRIIQLDRWTPSRNWDKYPEQKSKPIRLEAGKRYYIEALHHEASVDDCLAVGWQLPDGKQELPIPGKRLSTVDESQQ